MTLRLLALTLVVCLGLGCPPTEETCVDSSCWLSLQSWVAVDGDSVDGFLRWVYLSEHPEDAPGATPDCELWERLELTAVEVDPACDDCTHQFAGTATIEDEDSTCAQRYESWSFTYAFGSLGPEHADHERRGATHHVRTRWSPDLGETQGYQSLFVATPDSWDGGAPGSAATPSGEYALESLHYWDLR